MLTWGPSACSHCVFERFVCSNVTKTRLRPLTYSEWQQMKQNGSVEEKVTSLSLSKNPPRQNISAKIRHELIAWGLASEAAGEADLSRAH